MKENQTQEGTSAEITEASAQDLDTPGVPGQGGAVDVFGQLLEGAGVTDNFMAQKYRKLADAQKPVILTDKEYDETTGRLLSSTQRVKMVDDVTNQVSIMKQLGTIKGYFDKQREKNNIQKFTGRVFVVTPRPKVEDQDKLVTVSVECEEEDQKNTPSSSLVGPGWS